LDAASAIRVAAAAASFCQPPGCDVVVVVAQPFVRMF
jgi:hypothetical protein